MSFVSTPSGKVWEKDEDLIVMNYEMLHVKDISTNQMREYVMLLILELFPSLE